MGLYPPEGKDRDSLINENSKYVKCPHCGLVIKTRDNACPGICPGCGFEDCSGWIIEDNPSKREV